jgi:hypothetical protein
MLPGLYTFIWLVEGLYPHCPRTGNMPGYQPLVKREHEFPRYHFPIHFQYLDENDTIATTRCQRLPQPRHQCFTFRGVIREGPTVPGMVGPGARQQVGYCPESENQARK